MQEKYRKELIGTLTDVRSFMQESVDNWIHGYCLMDKDDKPDLETLEDKEVIEEVVRLSAVIARIDAAIAGVSALCAA